MKEAELQVTTGIPQGYDFLRLLFLRLFVFPDSSLYSPSWHRTHYADQTGLELTEICCLALVLLLFGDRVS